MHIAVDMDDVVLSFMPNVLACFEREFGEHVELTQGSWSPQAVAFTKHPKLLAAGYSSWWGWLRDRDWLWGLAPAVPGAIGGLQTLRNQGHYVELVTSKPEWAEPQVWKWLGRWRPPLNRVTVVRPDQSKLDFTDAKIIVDDKLATCVEWNADRRAAIWFNTYPDAPPTDELNPYLTEATSWDDVIVRLGGYAL